MKLIINTLIILAVGFTMTGCATTLGKHGDKYSNVSVSKLLQQKEMPEENKAIMVPALKQRAENDLQSGDFKSAIEHANLAAKWSPGDTHIKYLLAEALFKSGNTRKSQILFSELVETDPKAENFQGYGLSLLSNNKYPESHNWLNKAVVENGELWRSWNGLGMIYDKSKDWKNAEQAYKVAIAQEKNTSSYHNLAMSYMNQDRLEEALISFENAKALSDGNSYPDLQYRTALALSGKIDNALNGTTDAQASDLYNQLGVRAMRNGERGNAIKFLKLAIAKSPTFHANAEKNLALVTIQSP